jgi:hypothetical protein
LQKRWADGNKKQQKAETEALIYRSDLILVVLLTGIPHHYKEGD